MKFRIDKKRMKLNLIYIATAILLILFVVLIVLTVRGRKSKDSSGSSDGEVMTVGEDSGSSKDSFEMNAYPEVNALITQYFNASASCDFTVLDQIVNSLNDTDKTVIQRKSEYVESYNTVTIYTRLCPQEGSYLVFATYKIKFVNKDTQVPGLETLYVRTADDGKMYIYNGDVEPEVSSFINTVVNGNEAKELMQNVNEEYINILATDADILAFIEKFEGNSELVEQAKQKAAEEKTAEASAAESAKAEAEAASQAAAAQAAADAASQSAANAQTTNETVAVTSTVNVRQSNDENSAKVGSITVGENVTRVSLTDNGWSKIQFSGGEGYVKSDYVSTFKLTGDTVKAATTVNVRVECSETANMSGQLTADESYKRNAAYDNGWSQIVYNGVVAYVKSEYLTN